MAENLVVGVAVGAVACVLLGGLYTLLVGGETAATWSNYLMRVRVVAQFVAIVIIMAVVYFSGR
jgi:Hypoxia induced protein conserved region